MSKLIKGQLRVDKWSGGGQPQLEISSDEHIFWIAGVGAPCEDPEVAEAYARLFIASPKLLKACQALIDRCKDPHLDLPACEFCPALKQTEVAVAEATGEAQDADTG